jgi:hypothetical protein
MHKRTFPTRLVEGGKNIVQIQTFARLDSEFSTAQTMLFRHYKGTLAPARGNSSPDFEMLHRQRAKSAARNDGCTGEKFG